MLVMVHSHLAACRENENESVSENENGLGSYRQLQQQRRQQRQHGDVDVDDGDGDGDSEQRVKVVAAVVRGSYCWEQHHCRASCSHSCSYSCSTEIVCTRSTLAQRASQWMMGLTVQHGSEREDEARESAPCHLHLRLLLKVMEERRSSPSSWQHLVKWR